MHARAAARSRTVLIGAAAFVFASSFSVLPGVSQSVRQDDMRGSNPSDVIAALVPTGKLRAAINFGNAVLAQRDPVNGILSGVSVDLAHELGRRLDVPVELIAYDAAGKVAAAVDAGEWDIAFLANDPARAVGIAFSPPYVLIEGGYLVTARSPLSRVEDVDAPGIRIAAGKGSAYELYLSRTLKQAQLVLSPTSPGAIALFTDQKLDAVAGVRQQLLAFAKARPDLRVVEGRFMAIEQAVGTPKGCDAGSRYLRAFVEDVKASGFVAASLARSGQTDATVAPRSSPGE